MTDFKAEDSVRINDQDSLLAGRSGVIEYVQPDGHAWVQVEGFPLEKVHTTKLIKLRG